MPTNILRNADQHDIVTVDWLHSHLHDPQVVIIDCRFSLADRDWGRQQYADRHIEGAHYLDLNQDLSSAVQAHGGRHPLPDIDELATKLSHIGINSGETMVVAYDDSRFAFASRLWWLLRYMGHENVAVLDGGLAAWRSHGYPMTNIEPPKRTGKFTPQLQTETVVDREMVKARKDLSGVVLVDAREGDRYRGEREPIDPIAGHIEGAVNYPWMELTDAQGFVMKDQGDRWQSIANAEEIIVYCGSGVTACVNLLALKLAGIEAKLYAGSWSDWCSWL